VDAGESHESAAVREMQEELGLHVRVIRKVAEVHFNGNLQPYFLVETITGSSAPVRVRNSVNSTLYEDPIILCGCRFQECWRAMLCRMTWLNLFIGRLPKAGRIRRSRFLKGRSDAIGGLKNWPILSRSCSRV